jgi:AcrR family transcriptional regulator
MTNLTLLYKSEEDMMGVLDEKKRKKMLKEKERERERKQILREKERTMKRMLKEKEKERKRKQILREKERTMKRMLKEKEREKERKKGQILKAAIELYKTRGFDKTMVEDIALKANIATGTFYNFFEKKDDVFLYFWEQESEKSMKEFRHKMVTKDDFFEQLEFFISPLLKNVYKDKDFSHYIFVNKRLPRWGAKDRSEVRLIEALSRIVELAKQNNTIKKQFRTERIVEILFAIHVMYLMYWFHGSIKTRKEYIRRIREAVKIAFDGFSAK